MRRDFEGGDNSRCGEISRKYGSYDNYALYTPGDSMQVYNIQLDSITIHSVYLQYNGAQLCTLYTT